MLQYNDFLIEKQTNLEILNHETTNEKVQDRKNGAIANYMKAKHMQQN